MTRKIFSIFYVASFLVILFSFQTKLLAENSQRKPAVKAGVIGILSGPYSEVGQNIVDGLRLAHAQHKENNSKPFFELIIEDDQFQARQGVSAFKKLTEVDRVDFLINSSSPTFDAIYPSVSQMALPVLQLGEPGDDPKKDNVFFIPPPLVASTVTLGNHFRKQSTDKAEIAVMYSQLQAFSRLHDSLIEAYGENIPSFPVGMEETDLRSLVLRILRQEPKHLIILLPATQGAQVVREVSGRNLARRPRLYFESSFLASKNDYEKLLGDLSSMNEDIVSILELKATDEFISLFSEYYGRPPGLLAEIGYDAFLVMKETYDPDPVEWISRLATFRIAGASGEVSFNEFGQRSSEARLVTVAEILEKEKAE